MEPRYELTEPPQTHYIACSHCESIEFRCAHCDTPVTSDDIVSYGDGFQSYWYEEALEANWIAAYRVVSQDGKSVIAELRIFPDLNETDRQAGQWSGETTGVAGNRVPTGGLRGGTIKKVRTSQALQPIPDIATMYSAHGEPLLTDELVLNEDTYFTIFNHDANIVEDSVSKGTGRKRLSETELAELSVRFLELRSQGSSVSQAHAIIAGELVQATETIKSRLHKARERGLLMSSTDESPDRITSKARHLLGLNNEEGTDQ